ncbi:MAG: MmcQ/YjbR family DNA-binding protein [Planctomycetota bacterium]|jgi:predicted DNA-binding protein (MmcQ/YjbR family)
MAKTRPHRMLTKLRKFALALPEACEVEAWGHPTFRAGKKIFASFGHYEDRPCITVKSTIPEQQTLVTDPRFFVPAYVGHKGWVSMWVDRDLAWELIEDLIMDSYRSVALKRMLKALDE